MLDDLNTPLSDTQKWFRTTEAMPTKPAWARSERQMWAPTVAKIGHRWVMFFAADRPNPPQPQNAQCIGRAFSQHPAGSYVPDPHPFHCGHYGVPGALDPNLFQDHLGQWWLHAAFGNTPNPLQVLRLDHDANRVGTESTLLTTRHPWEYHFVENPSMVYDPARRNCILTYSAGLWSEARYTTGVARCATAAGPCTSNSAGPWVRTTSQGGQDPAGCRSSTVPAAPGWRSTRSPRAAKHPSVHARCPSCGSHRTPSHSPPARPIDGPAPARASAVTPSADRRRVASARAGPGRRANTRPRCATRVRRRGAGGRGRGLCSEAPGPRSRTHLTGVLGPRRGLPLCHPVHTSTTAASTPDTSPATGSDGPVVPFDADTLLGRCAVAGLETARWGNPPVAALVCESDGTVLAVAANTVHETHDVTAHAVRLALSALTTGGVSPAGLWVVVNAKPCTMCAAALAAAGVAWAVYGAPTEPGTVPPIAAEHTCAAPAAPVLVGPIDAGRHAALIAEGCALADRARSSF